MSPKAPRFSGRVRLSQLMPLACEILAAANPNSLSPSPASLPVVEPAKSL